MIMIAPMRASGKTRAAIMAPLRKRPLITPMTAP
jgi:hypothetical protein